MSDQPRPDDIIEELGGCGKYQWRLTVFVHLLKTIVCFSISSMVIISAPQQWTCIDACHNATYIFADQNVSNVGVGVECQEKSCYPGNGTEQCSRFHFNVDTRTMVSEVKYFWYRLLEVNWKRTFTVISFQMRRKQANKKERETLKHRRSCVCNYRFRIYCLLVKGHRPWKDIKHNISLYLCKFNLLKHLTTTTILMMMMVLIIIIVPIAISRGLNLKIKQCAVSFSNSWMISLIYWQRFHDRVHKISLTYMTGFRSNIALSVKHMPFCVYSGFNNVLPEWFLGLGPLKPLPAMPVSMGAIR